MVEIERKLQQNIIIIDTMTQEYSTIYAAIHIMENFVAQSSHDQKKWADPCFIGVLY